MFRLSAAALACALALVLSIPASATPITLSPSAGNSGHGIYGRTNVTIRSGNASQNVSAGAFDVTASQAITGLGNRFAAWCLDIDRRLRLPSQYDVTAVPFLADPLTSAQQGAIRALFNIASSLVIAGNNANSAGLQLALWEVVNETGSVFALHGAQAGSFRVTSTGQASNAARNVASGLLTQLATYDPANGRVRAIYLESRDSPTDHDRLRDSQNLAAMAPVPLPMAGGLLLAALAALGLWRRRMAAA